MTSTMRWVVRGAVGAAALGWFMVRPTGPVPTDVPGPGPGREHELVAVDGAVPPPTAVPAPPVEGVGPWVVWAVGTSYADEAGRPYERPVTVAVCVPEAALVSGADESTYALWTVPVSGGVDDVRDGDPCPVS
jgi:hypothetical protein